MSQSATLSGSPARRSKRGPRHERPRVRQRTTGRDRRSADPIDVLARRIDPVSVTAVDALEIAAALEADGVTDELAAVQYGYSNVFRLAEEIHRRVPLRLGERLRPTPSGAVTSARVWRGALFALPCVFFLALQGSLSSRAISAVLIAVTIAGWAASQGIAVMAYAVGGRAGRAAMRGFLRSTLLGALSLMALGAAAAAALGVDGTLIAVAAVQGAYLMGAITILSLERDRVFALVMIPGAALTMLAWALPFGGAPILVAVGLTVVAVLAASVAVTARPAVHGRRPRRHDLLVASEFAVYGTLAGALVAAPICSALFGGGAVSSWLALAMLPVTLSMGVAEVELRRYRLRVRGLLGTSSTPRVFADAAKRCLGAAFARYSATLIALTGVCVAVGWFVADPTAGEALLVSGYVAFGLAIFAALALISAQRVRTVTAVFALGLVAYVALDAQTIEPVGAVAAFLLSVAGMTALLLSITTRDAQTIVSHR